MLQNSNRVFVFKQVIASSVSGFLSICGGLAFGYSAVLLPALKQDKDFPYDAEYASWIASIAPLSMVIGCLCAGTMIDGLGRKPGHVVLAFAFVLSWLIQGFAYNNPVMLLGRFLTGLCSGAIRPITLVYLGEITDPKYRGIALFTPSIAMILGVILNHALGGYIHWRTNSFICCVPSVFAILLLLALKESPLWLISKGKTKEGVEVFKWFRGEGDAAEKELKSILDSQNKKTIKLSINDYLKVDFTRPLMISFFLSVASQFSGANVITFYAQEILEKIITSNYSAFTLMIITDCVRLTASTVILFFGRRFPRKISYMFSNFGACLMLYALLIFLYLKPQALTWLPIVLWILYISLGSAIVTLSWSFVAELFSSKLRGIGSGISSAISYFLLFISVQMSPSIISAYDERVLFGIFATVTLVNAVILCFLLPETSGRSLQEIEDDYNKKTVMVSRL